MQRRPYKPPWSAAAAEIVTNAGTQFDPSVVASFEAHEPAALVDPLRSAPRII
jgi:HD-GYP domain-containing protein (c-di-GMP phosphodiesterase class II)